MSCIKKHQKWIANTLLMTGMIMVVLATMLSRARAQEELIAPTDFDAPTYSSPIAMDAAKNLIWVVNPDDDSVSVIGNLSGTPTVLNKFIVGDEPRSIALDTNDGDPSDYRVYVANAADNGITIIHVTDSSASSVTAVIETPLLVTGAEPWDVVASPDGSRVFVANSGQDTITVIRTDTRQIVGNVTLRNTICNVGDPNRHFQPRGMAVTLDSTRLYVTRFLSFTADGGVQGDDNGKEGVVCQLDIPGGLGSLPTIANVVTLGARDTGFTIDKDGDTVPDPTAAYPNQMQSIVIRGNQAFVPNIAASPSGPLKFNVDTQAFVNVIDNATTGTPTDASATKFLNLHLGAREPEAGETKLFFANPWAIAFSNQSSSGNAYVVSAGSDLLVKLNVDAAGDLSFTVDDNTTRYIDLNDPDDPDSSGANAGKNPLGIVVRNIAPGNNRAFVMNFVSRNISVVDLDDDEVIDTVQLTALPTPGSFEEQLLVGAEIFFSSRGLFDDPGGATVSLEDRLSSEGWQNCASCHFNGLTDANVWAFGAGPRKSVPMNGTWSPYNPNDQRILNYSAIFDEVQDFELNIRNVSGPGPISAGPPPVLDPAHGLLIGDGGNVNAAPGTVNAFGIANGGRPQLTVTLPGSDTAWPALDAMKEWVRFAIRTPNGALTTAELTAGGGNATGGLSVSSVNQGRRLFFQAGCQVCHGGTKWTVSTKDFSSPPIAGDIFTESGAATAVQTQFLSRFLSDIGSFELGVAGGPNPIGDNVGAVELTDRGQDALGTDHNGDGQGDGYNIPSLLGIWNLQPYYHNGACETLDCVLSNVEHRTAGLQDGQNDPLLSTTNQGYVVEFLRSLDAETAFPTNLSIRSHDIFLDPPTVFKGSQVTVGANVSLFGTIADLQNLAADLGVTELTVRFTLSAGAGTTPEVIDVPLPLTAFNQNFGQATITTVWDVPAGSGVSFGSVSVVVDFDNAIPEAKETDNIASRVVVLRPAPPDTTPPTVTSIAISDDDPFDDTDAITVDEDVWVKIVATDDDSGVSAFCIVRYTYSFILRRWVEAPCVFRPLPAPENGTTDTFIVDTALQPRAGTGYVFVWVKDAEGNISSTPGFDVISFIPDAPVNLNRNDVMILRIPLTAGESVDLTFTPEFGDVDVSVFDDFTNPNANRIALSANNGTTPENVTLVGPGLFQVEVDAITNSRFTITFIESLGPNGATRGLTAVPQGDATLPTVGGPPALRSAVEDISYAFLPIIRE